MAEEIDQNLEELEVQPDAKPGDSKPNKRLKSRSGKLQIQECINELTAMSKDTSIRGPKRIDALLQKSALVTEMARLQAAEDSDAAAQELDTLKAQRAEDEATINQLQNELAQWKQKASERLVERVPDRRLAEQISTNLQQTNLLINTGQAVKQIVSEPDRLRIAAVLCRRSGRGAQSMISEMGVDFASIYMASQESSETLTARIDAASPEGQRGAAVLVAKSTLAARGQDYVYVGPRSTKPVYADVFYELDGR